MDTILQILVIIVLTFFEGVFVAAEIALVTIRRTRIEQLVEEGNRAREAGQAASIAQPGRFLAVTQIGLTFLGFLASAYAAVNLTTSLETLFAGHRAAGPQHVGRGARPDHRDRCVLSLFTIVFGELVPKSLGARPRRAVRAPAERLHRGPAARPRAARRAS